MSLIFLAGTAPAFLTEVVWLIVAGAAIAYVCNRFGLVPIVGFLLAGVVIGPNALGLVRDQSLVDAAAEIGVILLLYTIGIEFSLEKLAKIKRLIFGGGRMQVVLATLVMTGSLALFGVEWRTGLFTGFLVALSSTAIVLKLLGDRAETNSTQGQVGLGLLIFQDLAIIVMVLLVPVISGRGGSSLEIVWALAKAGSIIGIVLLFARRLMPKVLEMVARTCSPELFLLTVIAICFGTAYLTSLAGVSLSLGAFLAGLLVSESRFSEHAMSEILPLQILFSATFFISVGMLLDVTFLVRNLPLVLGAIAVILVVKIVTTGISVRVLGYHAPVAAASALMLAQVGEFSFVLERAGREVGLSPAGLGESGSQTFIASTVVLMVATPVLMQVGSRFAGRLETKQKQTAAVRMEAEPTPENVPYLEDHVIVAGYGQAARRLVHVLKGSRIPYIITTLSPEGANEADAQGLPVLRGDSSKQRTLMLAGIERAKIMVIADDGPTMTARIASVTRATNPTLRIVARTRYITEIEPLTRAGVDRVVTEELESIVGLFADVLNDYRIPKEEIERYEEAMRRGGYAALISAPSSDEQPAVVCELNNERLDSRTITIRAGAPVTEQTLAELALDERGLMLHNVRRNGEVLADVTQNSRLQVGDELVICGDTEAFARNSSLFRSTTGEDTSSTVEATDDADHSGIVDIEKVVKFMFDGHSNACSHTAQARDVMPSARGCEECLAMGDTWVHLRICMTCGHVGCCDSSKNKHASKHYPVTNHPIISSLERGEDWNWCYADQIYI